MSMNGCAFAYFAKSVYDCIAANCPKDVKMDESELPFERRVLIQKVCTYTFKSQAKKLEGCAPASELRKEGVSDTAADNTHRTSSGNTFKLMTGTFSASVDPCHFNSLSSCMELWKRKLQQVNANAMQKILNPYEMWEDMSSDRDYPIPVLPDNPDKKMRYYVHLSRYLEREDNLPLNYISRIQLWLQKVFRYIHTEPILPVAGLNAK